MQTFRLPTGHVVTTQRVPGASLIEFTTRRDNDVISTVRHTFAESVPLIKRMACFAR
ncbi:hypothetical protein HOV11_gp36 [Streptomyces phage Vash]|uniref:Uncharacterized protein n=1 Tax=Streptomyces phage Vash TaxID=2510568 RepID=A0A411AYY6_9CAUD|nr:hypothetical protein HOV11_gp36 [Streptomyces phage Vash]QAX93292.1 hypothetical protein SEA_VASH_36 [Streptomyces phage Vash]